MNPNEFGKKLGIGLRVAGRIAQQRVEQSAAAPGPSVSNPPSSNPPSSNSPSLRQAVDPRRIKQAAVRSHNMTRAAGRGIGGFLRPFSKVGGLLWLEVTGFFFGLFALFFAQNIWRARLDYAAGPQHNRFLIGCVLSVVFGYLSISAFWRARRR